MQTRLFRNRIEATCLGSLMLLALGTACPTQAGPDRIQRPSSSTGNRTDSAARRSDGADVLNPRGADGERNSDRDWARVGPEKLPKGDRTGGHSDAAQEADLSRVARDVQARINQSPASQRSLAAAARARNVEEAVALLERNGFPSNQLKGAKVNFTDETGGAGPGLRITITITIRFHPLEIDILISRALGQSSGDTDSGTLPRPVIGFPRDESGGNGLQTREPEGTEASQSGGERGDFRVTEGEGGAAVIELGGPRGERHHLTIREGDSPMPYLREGQGEAGTGHPNTTKSLASAWLCFVAQMKSRVGPNVWLQICGNWAACWNQASKKKKWWQKVASFISCAWNGPYRNQAIASFKACAF